MINTLRILFVHKVPNKLKKELKIILKIILHLPKPLMFMILNDDYRWFFLTNLYMKFPHDNNAIFILNSFLAFSNFKRLNMKLASNIFL